MPSANWINIAQLADFEAADRKVVSAGDRPVLLLRHDGGFYAVDNRCPHMGFPLDKGTVKDCILTCRFPMGGPRPSPLLMGGRASPIACRIDRVATLSA